MCCIASLIWHTYFSAARYRHYGQKINKNCPVNIFPTSFHLLKCCLPVSFCTLQYLILLSSEVPLLPPHSVHSCNLYIGSQICHLKLGSLISCLLCTIHDVHPCRSGINTHFGFLLQFSSLQYFIDPITVIAAPIHCSSPHYLHNHLYYL